jgi:exopolysaccharide biosynthesis protein
LKDKKSLRCILVFILREGIFVMIFALLLIYGSAYNNVKAAEDKGIQIININESNFKGYIILIKDPKRIAVGVTPNLGQSGATLKEIINANNAVGGINAGGFVDVNLMGNGAKPIGILINNKKVIFKQSGLNKFSVTGFNNNNVLVTSNSMTVNEIKNNNFRCVASFGPALIAYGKPLAVTGGGSQQPRSAIGQRKDGTVIQLAIDGRQLRSQGANYHDLQKLLLKYGAYTAANLDGGSSTTLVYQGKTLNSPSDILGDRSLPSAFIILPDNSKTNKTLSSINTASENSKTNIMTNIPTGATNLSFSYDNRYCVYLNKGIIYIQEIKTNKIIQKISENSQIAKSILMEDRNIAVYFTIEKKSTSTLETVNIYTYNIDKNERTFQQSFSISAGSTIKDVQYSNLTNIDRKSVV